MTLHNNIYINILVDILINKYVHITKITIINDIRIKIKGVK